MAISTAGGQGNHRSQGFSPIRIHVRATLAGRVNSTQGRYWALDRCIPSVQYRSARSDRTVMRPHRCARARRRGSSRSARRGPRAAPEGLLHDVRVVQRGGHTADIDALEAEFDH
jgi:hypothetical protein